MPQFRTFRAQLSPHTSVDLITSVPGTFKVEPGDGSVRRAHEQALGDSSVKTSEGEQARPSDDKQQETTKLECFIDIPQSSQNKTETAQVPDSSTKTSASSSTSNTSVSHEAPPASPRPLKRSTRVLIPFTSTSAGSSSSPEPARTQPRTLASLGRAPTQIIPSSSSSDNPQNTSAVSLVPTEPDIDWDSPTAARDELNRLDVKVVDFAYAYVYKGGFSSEPGDKRKGKGKEKAKEKPFLQPLVRLTRIPVNDLDMDNDTDADTTDMGTPMGGLPIDDEYIQELLAETARRESMMREKENDEADDNDDEEIRGWIEEFRDHRMKEVGALTEEEEVFCEGFGVGLGKRKDAEQDDDENTGKRRRVDEATSSSSSVANDSDVPTLSASPVIDPSPTTSSSPPSAPIPRSSPSKRTRQDDESSKDSDISSSIQSSSPRKKRRQEHEHVDANEDQNIFGSGSTSSPTLPLVPSEPETEPTTPASPPTSTLQTGNPVNPSVSSTTVPPLEPSSDPTLDTPTTPTPTPTPTTRQLRPRRGVTAAPQQPVASTLQSEPKPKATRGRGRGGRAAGNSQSESESPAPEPVASTSGGGRARGRGRGGKKRR